MRETTGYFITEDDSQLASTAGAAPPDDSTQMKRLRPPESTPTNLSFRLEDCTVRELARFLSAYYNAVIDESSDSRRFNFEFTIRMPSGDDPGDRRLDLRREPEAEETGIGVRQRKGSIDFLVIDRVAPESSFLGK